METDTLITALDEAGLSPYQTRAYVAVLELGAASATEIATTSEVPDPRIYDVLRTLEDRGYVETYTQGTLHARAHDPQEALADLRGRAQRFSEAADEIEERWQRPALPRSEHEISVVSRFETVLERARNAIATAEYQVRLSVSPTQFESLSSALESASRNDVVVHLSVHTHPEESEELPDEDDLTGRCTEMRHRPLPAPFLALVDRTVICYAPHAESASQYGLLVDDRAHAYVFYWYYLTCLWQPWEAVYIDHSATQPTRYIDIRQCIREIEPRVRDGGVEVCIEGRDTATGGEQFLTGRVTDVRYPDTPAGDEPTSLVQLAGRASLTLETGDRTYSIGGWGAILEDFEATHITIVDTNPQP